MNAHNVIHRVKPLTSLKLTVFCLACAIVLVFLGTLDHVHLGVYEAENRYCAENAIRPILRWGEIMNSRELGKVREVWKEKIASLLNVRRIEGQDPIRKTDYGSLKRRDLKRPEKAI